jgi:hypothetical protein
MHWRRLSGIGGRQDGSSLIEVAVVMPPFFLLLYGIVAFAIALNGFASATYGAREAARYCSLHSSTSLVPCGSSGSPGCPTEMAIVQPLIFGAATNGLTITTSYANGDVIGGWVVVQVKVKYNLMIPFSSLSSITVGSQAQRPIVR